MSSKSTQKYQRLKDEDVIVSNLSSFVSKLQETEIGVSSNRAAHTLHATHDQHDSASNAVIERCNPNPEADRPCACRVSSVHAVAG